MRAHSPRTRLLDFARSALWFAPLSAALLGMVLVLYTRAHVGETEFARARTLDIVALHANIISRELTATEADLRYLAEQPALRSFLGDGEARAALEADYVRLCRERARYDQVRVLDARGMERVRVNYGGGDPLVVPEEALQDKSARYYFRDAIGLERGEVFTSPLDLNVERGALQAPWEAVIRFATPIVDDEGRTLGLLVLNYRGESLLSELVGASSHGPGMTLLVDGAGNYLRGPEPGKVWGFMFGEEYTLQADFPDVWAAINAAPEGQVVSERGLFTFRVVRPPGVISPTGARAGLTVVSFVSPNALSQRPRRLLRRLGGVALLASVLLFVLVLWLTLLSERRRLDAVRLAASEDRLRRLSSQLLRAQEEERRSISRDLHDELGQQLTAMILQLQRAARTADVARKDDLIGWGVEGAQGLLATTHDLAARLRPSLLDDLGLVQALESFAAAYEQRTGIAVALDVALDEPPPVVSENLFRIFQESLQNVARHAGCDAVSARVEADDGGIVLVVRDRGVGFDPAAVDPERLGLLGMRERVELLGGEFTLNTAPGRGTEVRTWIPLSS